MKFGVQLPTGMEGLALPLPYFGPQDGAHDLVAAAITLERLGYDSVWGNDHYATQDYVRKHWNGNP